MGLSDADLWELVGRYEAGDAAVRARLLLAHVELREVPGIMRHVAGELLLDKMTRAFQENPRGELYRGLDRVTLWNMLKQNIAEVELATAHGDNDILDKLADCGNYLAFLYRNLVDPLEGQPASFHLVDGITTREAMALIEHLLVKYGLRVVDTSGFGEAMGSKPKVVAR